MPRVKKYCVSPPTNIDASTVLSKKIHDILIVISIEKKFGYAFHGLLDIFRYFWKCY